MLSRHVLKNMTVKWFKKKNVCFAKIWKPSRQRFGFFEDWQKFGKVLKLGVTLILRYLLTDLLLIQTKLALVRPRPYAAMVSVNKVLSSNRYCFRMLVN